MKGGDPFHVCRMKKCRDFMTAQPNGTEYVLAGWLDQSLSSVLAAIISWLPCVLFRIIIFIIIIIIFIYYLIILSLLYFVCTFIIILLIYYFL